MVIVGALPGRVRSSNAAIGPSTTHPPKPRVTDVKMGGQQARRFFGIERMSKAESLRTGAGGFAEVLGLLMRPA
jgi:hypothetical protein